MRKLILVVAALAAGCGFLPVESKDDGLLPISRPPQGTERDLCAVPARRSEIRVDVESGTLEGARQGTATAYLGIPYADARRFQMPQRTGCWSGVRDATKFAALCAQPGPDGAVLGSEDCLALNVFVPQAAPLQKRPVLVFLHGGDGRTGGTHAVDGQSQLDGASLASAEDAVVVTVEWRLGAFGFASHPVLRAEGEGAGNYGLLDTVAALQWVKRNAAAFGADPSRVLVFGEAAGAVNVCALVTAPQANGLFSAALMQSGACVATSAALRDEQGRALADTAGCEGPDVASCLRTASAQAVAELLPLPAPLLASWGAAFGPTLDGLVLPEAPLAALAAGHRAPVPLAIGSNRDEFALFLPDEMMPSCTEYAPYLGQVFGTLAAQVEQHYPCDEARGAAVSAVAAITDALYTCPARRAARAASAGQLQGVYRYLYAHSRAYGPLATLRAFHSAELPYLFDTLAQEGYAPTAAEEVLSKSMQGYWASLARGDSPRSPFGPAWHRYDPNADAALWLDETVREAPVDAAGCDFWDAVVQ